LFSTGSLGSFIPAHYDQLAAGSACFVLLSPTQNAAAWYSDAAVQRTVLSYVTPEIMFC